MIHKNYKRAVLGSELLQVGNALIKERFSWACMTGEFDRTKARRSASSL
jgi:hypothetical protein